MPFFLSVKKREKSVMREANKLNALMYITVGLYCARASVLRACNDGVSVNVSVSL